MRQILHKDIAKTADEINSEVRRFQAQLVDSAVREVRLEFAGELVDLNAAPVTRSFLAGLLRDVSARVNAVRASPESHLAIRWRTQSLRMTNPALLSAGRK